MNKYETAADAKKNGLNIAEQLRHRFGGELSEAEIIEISYHFQAGSYIQGCLENYEASRQRAAEIAREIAPSMKPGDTILDIGTGELTTLSLVIKALSEALDITQYNFLACDISVARLTCGESFSRVILRDTRLGGIQLFCADMQHLPLPSKSVDLVISCHALEPNRSGLQTILSEITRVSARGAILFEPNYERSCQASRQRMDRHGYIKNLEESISRAGATVQEVRKMAHQPNPLNATFAHHIHSIPKSPKVSQSEYTYPGTDKLLSRVNSHLVSGDQQVAFPVFGGIPILRLGKEILC